MGTSDNWMSYARETPTPRPPYFLSLLLRQEHIPTTVDLSHVRRDEVSSLYIRDRARRY